MVRICSILGQQKNALPAYLADFQIFVIALKQVFTWRDISERKEKINGNSKHKRTINTSLVKPNIQVLLMMRC